MNSRLSTIFHWFLTRWGDAIDRQDYVRAEKVKNTAKKHLEALLKEEYRRGWRMGNAEGRANPNICDRCGTGFADYHICGTGRNL